MTQPHHPKTLPGPWKLIRGKSASYQHEFIVETADGAHVAAWSVPRDERNNTQARAKYIHAARLIAAAPDLLKALEKIIEMNRQWALDQYGDATKAENMDCVRVARAAITKATGEKI